MPKPFLTKVTAVVLSGVLFSLGLYAQKAPAKTKVSTTDTTKTDSVKRKLTQRAMNIFLEAGGPGLLSLDYDTRILNTADGLGVRIGITDLPISHRYHIVVPLQFNYLIGSKSDYLELGLGATMVFYQYTDPPYITPDGEFIVNTPVKKRSSAAATATIGYRYQPATSGFNFRIGFTPGYAFSDNGFIDPKRFAPFGGVSFGYTFRHFQPEKKKMIDTGQKSAYWAKGDPLKKTAAVAGFKTDTLKLDSITRIRRAKNIFFEAGGPGLLSLNYDERFLPKRDGFGFRAGFGGIPTSGSQTLTVPLQLNYLWGKGNKFFEAGIGTTIVFYDPGIFVKDSFTLPSGQVIDESYTTHVNRSFEAATTTLAYRYQPAKGGLNFRAGVSPALILNRSYLFYNVNRLTVLPEVSIGYTFKR